MSVVEYALLASGSLFAIINPLAAVPAFLAMTPDDTPGARARMAARACLTCAAVLVVFSAFGRSIFKVLGISLPSFQIAGGLVLLLASLDSIRAKRSPLQETAEEMAEGVAKEDVSITPLAIPMLSGPGAITTAIVLESKARTLAQHAALYGCILAVSLASYLIFRLAASGARRINPIAMSVTMRLMGLLLVATGVEFILGALRSQGIAP